MRIVFIGVLILLAVIILISGLKNKRRISGAALVVVLLPAALLGYTEYVWQNNLTKFGTAVQLITENKKSTLECQRMSAAFMDAWASETTIEAAENNVGLKYNMCSQLFAWGSKTPETREKPTIDEAKAFHLLTAESVRVAGKTKTETEVQCLGIRNMKTIIRKMGGTKWEADTLHYIYSKEVAVKNHELAQLNC